MVDVTKCSLSAGLLDELSLKKQITIRRSQIFYAWTHLKENIIALSWHKIAFGAQSFNLFTVYIVGSHSDPAVF